MNNPYRLPDPGIQKSKKQIEKEATLEEYYKAVCELDELEEKYGLKEPKKEGRISRSITRFFERKENEAKVTVSKKKYIWMAILLGWAGGHRFYVKQWKIGLVYLLTCWGGFSVAHTLVDLLIVVPMKPDENGNIMM